MHVSQEFELFIANIRTVTGQMVRGYISFHSSGKILNFLLFTCVSNSKIKGTIRIMVSPFSPLPYFLGNQTEQLSIPAQLQAEAHSLDSNKIKFKGENAIGKKFNITNRSSTHETFSKFPSFNLPFNCQENGGKQ